MARWPLIVDPFCDGAVLSAEDCGERLLQTHGDSVRLVSDHLVAAGPKQILVRMLNNLRYIYLEQEDYARALGVLDRIVLIVGDTRNLRRDRGLLFARLRLYSNAWADLAAYLGSARSGDEDDGEADDHAEVVREQLERVRRLAAAPN